ncbi:hypothetical protein ACH4SK_38500 [Streptomyces inhibens]|uniref:hypothetical protein n=1 Tax=Streptomyces inhibens TaxID=2293571 RepID=UPI0037891703
MTSFPDRFRIKHLLTQGRRSASDTNSATHGMNMPGNTRSEPGNWSPLPAAAAFPAPPLIVINPPEGTLAQATLLVTAVLWVLATWRNRTSATRS